MLVILDTNVLVSAILTPGSTGADWLVSGDQDLLAADLTDLVVVTPTEAVERLGL